MPILGEGEFLVLGANPEARLRLDALFEPADEIVAPLDRRHVDLIASHAGVPAKKGRDLTRGSAEAEARRQNDRRCASVVHSPSSAHAAPRLLPGAKRRYTLSPLPAISTSSFAGLNRAP